jgi:hypothetical protein
MELLSNMSFWRLIKVSDNPLTYLSVPYYKVKFPSTADLSDSENL